MKTFLISESDVIPLIHSEYPTLSKYKLQDVQRICSGDGRKYNVFLVHAPDSPWKQIVAKSNWHENSDLCDEVRMSDYLKDTKVPAPIPLFPYKEGNSFVLLPYIDGTSAAELIQDDDKVEEVFAAIGATLKKLYSVSVPGFGKFWKDPEIQWIDYIDEKFSERLTLHIPKELVPEIKDIYEENRELVRKDAEDGPKLIHRDIYSDNFIIEKGTGNAVLIDFAMAIGGRPFYDIAKFMVIDVISYPQGLETFLEHAGIKKGGSEWGLLRTYVILELIGMINFFKSIEDMEKEEMARSLLYEVVEGKGKFSELLEELRG